MKRKNGFFVLPHELTKLSMWNDEYSFKLMLYCIDQAAHKAHEFDGKRIEVGQFPTSYRKMEQDLGWGHQTLRTHLNKLQHQYREIDVISGSHGTLVIVLKYKEYQNGSFGVLSISTPDNDKCAVSQHESVLNDDTSVCCQSALQNNSTKQVQNNIYIATLEKQFSSLWDAYPRQQNRKAGLAEYKRQIASGATHEAIMSALSTAKESIQWRQDGGKYIPNIARWLSDETWRNHLNDEQEEYRNKWGTSY